MDLNKLKDFLPITTVLLVIFYVSAFFIKLGEMIYFRYPFALFKFSFADALFYSMKAIPIILLSVIYSVTIYQIFSKFKKSDRATWIIFYGFFLLYVLLLVIGNVFSEQIIIMQKLKILLGIFEAFGVMLAGFLIIGFMNFRLREDFNNPREYLTSLGNWYFINICMASVLFSSKGDTGWLVISIAFSTTLNTIKCFEYAYIHYTKYLNSHDLSEKRIINNLYSLLIILPIISTMFYGFLFHQIPFIDKTITNDGGVVVGQYDNSLIIGYCDNKEVYFKIVDPNLNKELRFSKLKNENSTTRMLQTCT